MDMEEIAYKLDKRVHSVDDCLLSTGEDEKLIINTKGLDVSYRNNAAIAYVSVVAKDGEDIKTGEGFKVDMDFEKLDPAALSRTAVDEAVSMFGAKPVSSGSYPIIMRHDAAYRLLRTFAPVFCADNVQKRLSLLNGKIGADIAAANVNLIDDPLLEGSYTSKPFDDEGVASMYKEVISGGKLITFLHSLKTARKDCVQSTGNASRASYKSPVEVAPTNMYIKPGEKSYDELVKEMQDGLVISDIQGLHSGANQISGDFSLSARGYCIKGGRIESTVEQITVAGNFYQVMKDVIETGSDLEFSLPSKGSTFGSPSLLIKSLSVSGE
jgi:PmbA protein